MKLVKIGTVDVEQFRKALRTSKLPPPALHHEELSIDGLDIGLARPQESEDPRTNTYSVGFKCGDSDYLIVVRPTVHQIPSITLNIVQKKTDEAGSAQFASYTVLKDTVTTLKAEITNIPNQGGGTEQGVPTFDFQELLNQLKVQ